MLAALLVLGAMVVDVVADIGDGIRPVVIEALDSLLIVFILLELLAGVRATIVSHQLVAEPFLVAGIIASIKEIILLSLKATPGDETFDDSLQEIGVLGVLVLLLAVARSSSAARSGSRPRSDDRSNVYHLTSNDPRRPAR